MGAKARTRTKGKVPVEKVRTLWNRFVKGERYPKLAKEAGMQIGSLRNRFMTLVGGEKYAQVMATRETKHPRRQAPAEVKKLYTRWLKGGRYPGLADEAGLSISSLRHHFITLAGGPEPYRKVTAERDVKFPRTPPEHVEIDDTGVKRLKSTKGWDALNIDGTTFFVAPGKDADVFEMANGRQKAHLIIPAHKGLKTMRLVSIPKLRAKDVHKFVTANGEALAQAKAGIFNKNARTQKRAVLTDPRKAAA